MILDYKSYILFLYESSKLPKDFTRISARNSLSITLSSIAGRREAGTHPILQMEDTLDRAAIHHRATVHTHIHIYRQF